MRGAGQDRVEDLRGGQGNRVVTHRAEASSRRGESTRIDTPDYRSVWQKRASVRERRHIYKVEHWLVGPRGLRRGREVADVHDAWGATPCRRGSSAAGR